MGEQWWQCSIRYSDLPPTRWITVGPCQYLFRDKMGVKQIEPTSQPLLDAGITEMNQGVELVFA